MQKIIGITGGIGSGKTTATNFIKHLGFPVYNSDISSKKLISEDINLRKSIIDLLGNDAYDENGYNTRYVSKLIFSNEKLRLDLNAIIHPAVNKHFKDWSNKQNNKIIFRESALLFELKLHLQCYKNILITAEKNIRINRVMYRDSKTYQDVESIMKTQMLEEEKIKLADYIIENNKDIEDLKFNIYEIITKII